MFTWTSNFVIYSSLILGTFDLCYGRVLFPLGILPYSPCILSLDGTRWFWKSLNITQFILAILFLYSHSNNLPSNLNNQKLLDILMFYVKLQLQSELTECTHQGYKITRFQSKIKHLLLKRKRAYIESRINHHYSHNHILMHFLCDTFLLYFLKYSNWFRTNLRWVKYPKPLK